MSGAASPVDAVVAGLAVRSLPGAPELVALPASDHPELVDRATAARLLGPLLAAVRDGELSLEPEPLAQAVRRQEEAQAWCLQVEVRLLEVREWFAGNGGVDHVVLKGPAVAHLDEQDPAQRFFADLDLLLHPDGWDAGVAAIAAHGASRPWAELRPGFDRRFGKGLTLTCPDGLQIDVHRSLTDGAHGFRVPVRRLFEHRTAFDLGGVPIGALSQVHRVLHACLHAVLGSPDPRMSSLRDLARYFVATEHRVDDVVREAERWRAVGVLQNAVTMTRGRLTFDAPRWSAWSASVAVDPREQRLIDRQRDTGSGVGRNRIDALRELGWRDRVAYAHALALPSREHLRSRGRRRGWSLRPRPDDRA